MQVHIVNKQFGKETIVNDFGTSCIEIAKPRGTQQHLPEYDTQVSEQDDIELGEEEDLALGDYDA